MSNETRELWVKLRWLYSYADSVSRDLNNFLEDPTQFDAPEYFQDVADAAEEMRSTVLEVQALLRQRNTTQKEDEHKLKPLDSIV